MNEKRHPYHHCSLALGLCLLSLGLTSCFMGSDTNNPLSQYNPCTDATAHYWTDEKPFGKSYAEWIVEWWKWAMQTPATDARGNIIHPLLDSTGRFAGNGQSASSPVYYLGGWFGSGTYVRTVTVPHGKALFFPMINTFYDATRNRSLDSMRYYRDTLPHTVPEIQIQVDSCTKGIKPNTHRFKSGPITVKLPDRNLYQYWGNWIPAGQPVMYLLDGCWLMLAPPRKRTHTIHFSGRQDTTIIDMTYNITVQ